MSLEKVALTIAGSDSGGGAGVQIDLKTFNAIGVFGASVITSLTTQNTLGVQGIYDCPSEFVERQLESVFSDLNVLFTKTGMLSSNEIITTVVDRLKFEVSRNLKGIVVDPVMRSKHGSPLLKEDAIDNVIRNLIPITYIMTPNIPEAELLTGIRIKSLRDMEKAANEIHKMGTKIVVVKGGHLEGDYAIDLVYDGNQITMLKEKKAFNGDVHGTGCCFSASITAYLTKGESPINAIRKAKKFVSKSIKRGVYIGNGFRVLKTY